MTPPYPASTRPSLDGVVIFGFTARIPPLARPRIVRLVPSGAELQRAVYYACRALVRRSARVRRAVQLPGAPGVPVLPRRERPVVDVWGEYLDVDAGQRRVRTDAGREDVDRLVLVEVLRLCLLRLVAQYHTTGGRTAGGVVQHVHDVVVRAVMVRLVDDGGHVGVALGVLRLLHFVFGALVIS